jgi:hypothetical protein
VIDNGERRIALISFENGDVSRTEDLYRALKNECGLEKENILFSAVHSHEAPTFSHEHWRMIGHPEKKQKVIEYGDYIIKQTIFCVKEAIEKLRPARYGFGKGESYINVSRDEQFENGLWAEGRNFKKYSDKTVGYLEFVDDDGKIIAGIVNYAVHGDMCFRAKDEKNEKYLISGDIPGMTSDFLEKRYEQDGAVFLWTSGAAGDQNPIFPPALWTYEQDGSRGEGKDIGYIRWALAENLAGQHATDVVRIINSMKTDTEFMDIKIVDSILELPGQKIVYPASEESPLDRAKRKFEGRIDSAEPVKVVLKLMVLGNVAIFGLNGELFSEIGKKIKDISPVQNTIIITHTAERAGYLPTKEAYDNKTPEFYGSDVKDGCTEEFLLPRAKEMFEEI